MPKVSDRLFNNIQHTSLFLGWTIPRPNEILWTVSRNVRQLERNSKQDDTKKKRFFLYAQTGA